MFPTLRLAAALTLGLALLAPASAQQGNDMERLAEFLPPSGEDGTWRFVKTAESFEIENLSDPYAIQYFYVGPLDGEAGRRTVEVVLAIHPESTGSAGLLYGLTADRALYHMLTLAADGQVTFYRRDGQGFRPMIETTSGAYQAGQVNRLTISEDGDGIVIALNGTELGEVAGDWIGGGAVGIGAVGDVRAFFDGFSVSTP